MTVRGVQLRVSCKNGEQYDVLGAFWDEVRKYHPKMLLVGIGHSWENDTFCYLIGKEGGLPEKTVEKVCERFPEADSVRLKVPDGHWDVYRGRLEWLDEMYEEIYKDGPLIYEMERIHENGAITIFIRRKYGALYEYLPQEKRYRAV
ncbi:MAG: hypothetical protein J6I98_01310 [Clostridia bacterium]|nr:hypothetical protein [Clostridia bacterium]